MKVRTTLLSVLLLGAILTLFLLQPPSKSNAWENITPLSNTKFLKAPPVISMKATAAREALGTPNKEKPNSCGVKAHPNIGTTWQFEHEGENYIAEMHVCVYKGFVIANEKRLMLLEKGVIAVYEEEYIAADLIKALVVIEEESPDTVILPDDSEVAI